MKALTAESIKKFLKAKNIGEPIYLFEEVGSTNEVATELGRNGAIHGTVVISDSQTKGRGRLQRKWISPPGLNLYMSVVFRPKIDPSDAPLLTFVAAIAVYEAVKRQGATASIKWPNDVLIDKKKVAGMLTEMQSKGERVDFVVVGIGVNLNMTREIMEKEMGEVAEIATSIKEATGREIDRVRFIATLIDELEIWYQRFMSEGKALIIKEWTERWGASNRRVRAMYDENTIEGIATGVNESGHLVIKKDDGTTEVIVAGDVVLL
jgi:BirA family biotin operon repressor/biotin-[acetyl-CoA-carboxylase] ligase